jgi:mannose-1-phosphate guanylyltransferase/phosphomannomutase
VYLRRTPEDTQSTDAIFFDGLGFDLPAGRAQSVERLFATEDARRADPEEIGVIEYPEGTITEYRNELLHRIDINNIRGNGFRIVVDYGGGPAGSILPSILEALGVSAVSLNSLPQPTDTATHDLDSLSRIVRALGYDFGIMISPPGERLDLIDRHGTVLSAQQLLLVMAALFWRAHPGAPIAAPVVATARLEELAKKSKSKVIRVKNDHLSMMRVAASREAQFVCGTRGGFILPPWQRGADAMVSITHLLGWLATTGLSLTDLAAECQTGVIRSASVACPWNVKGRLMRRIMSETSDYPRDLVDGVRVHFDHDWVWVAPDRRTAHFSVLVEAAHGWRADSLLSEWVHNLGEWRDKEETEAESVSEHQAP